MEGVALQGHFKGLESWEQRKPSSNLERLFGRIMGSLNWGLDCGSW